MSGVLFHRIVEVEVVSLREEGYELHMGLHVLTMIE